ncbi:ABC transporter ATP-binding protein [Maritalea myrionectae]|uniref:ABC transporter ATP-binding protein n=1 Tax=Maritalea myrionectae TaxID=454601 RepID=UPI00048686AB|nr:ABC transporter ATP-binding protein [Maritalea myrionectae]
MLGGRAIKPVLDVTDLRTVFHTQDGTVHAVNGISFYLEEGELLSVVGESGSGKSVTMMSLLKLLPIPPAEIVAGTVEFDGNDLLKLEPEALRQVRGGDIGFIFQDPMTSLNPVFKVGFQIMEPLKEHLGLSEKEARKRAVELLELVGIPSASDRLDDYPHQFSGGMRQRVMIAIALACDPKILIADEPTTALDVTIQAQIIELVKKLRQKLGMAIVWITHDLGVAAGISDRIMVMYAGFVVEHAKVKDLYKRPLHPYTRALLATLPTDDEEGEDRLKSISGLPPALHEYPNSCPFAPRCEHAFDRCQKENPLLMEMGDGHQVACWWDVEKGAPR